MNRAVFKNKTLKRHTVLKSYLTSELPPYKYGSFLRGNLLVFIGYVIATLETFIGIYYGLTGLTFRYTLYISGSILTLSMALFLITYFKRNLRVWHELLIFGIYLITYLFSFCIWIYRLGDLRILGILNALTAVTIVLTYTNVIQSLVMSMSTLICYYAVTWYSIKIAGQPGSLVKEAFLSFCLFPGFLLISAAANYVNRKRKDLQKAKCALEKLNSDLSDANDKLKKEHLLTEIEMDLASEIQKAIFPGKVPDISDWDIAFMTKPYGAVSGDFYDFYCGENSLKGVSLFDVSGHGVAPALITILAKPLLYSHFSNYATAGLGAVLEAVNSDLLDELEEVNLYITGLLLRMNGTEVEYVNAGHPDLLHFQSSSKNVRVITDSSDTFKGHPIGISLRREKYSSLKLSVQSGDFIILYSDGLTESRNYTGEQFGIARLSETIASSNGGDAAAVLHHIIEALNNFTGYIKAADDITIIVAGKI